MANMVYTKSIVFMMHDDGTEHVKLVMDYGAVACNYVLDAKESNKLTSEFVKQLRHAAKEAPAPGGPPERIKA